jgi:hypothetical protein
MFRNRPVSLALVGLFAWVTACTSYTQIEPGEVADHDRVRVETTDGEKETLRDPRVEADSVKGLREKAGDRVPVSIPVDQIVGLQAVGTDEGRTAVTVVSVVAAALLVMYTVFFWEECDRDFLKC